MFTAFDRTISAAELEGLLFFQPSRVLVGEVRSQGGRRNGLFVGNNPINRIDPLGLAYIASRPLISWDAKLGAWAFDVSPVHTQIFFEDGKQPSNIGWDNKRGVTPESDAKKGMYDDESRFPLSPAHFDDATMREAVENVQKTGEWGPGTVTPNHHCQGFCDAAFDEYQKLMKNKKKPCK